MVGKSPTVFQCIVCVVKALPSVVSTLGYTDALAGFQKTRPLSNRFVNKPYSFTAICGAY
jgi:hypothetical protein